MSESLYFNLLFHNLSDDFGNINPETLQILSNTHSEINLDKINELYKNWKQAPQMWCFKPSLLNEKQVICPVNNIKISILKTDDSIENICSVIDTKSSDPIMVIHVCDEQKNLNKDFHCPKHLLISEMKYFASYLSSDSQNLEDVDISVHCDINIFEWLIKYVKRSDFPEIDRVSVSTLKPNNVISILISSDFLKMDLLIDECLSFIHENIDNLLVSSNMSCIPSSLITRLSNRFSDIEIEKIVDKKDKLKSILYRNKIECLYDLQNCKKLYTIASATQIFKCKFCEKILIKNHEQNIRCIDSRLCVNTVGVLIYCHEISGAWTIDDQLFEWVMDFRTSNHSILDTTAMVYWRLWSILNILQCDVCNEIFPLSEIGHCRFHTDPPRYGKDDGRSVIPITEGMYLCCGMKTLRFDPFQINKGCKSKNHIPKLYTNNIKYIDENGHLDKIIYVLENYKYHFEIPFVRDSSDSDFTHNVIGRDRLLIRSKFSESVLKDNEDSSSECFVENNIRPRLQPLIRLSGLKKFKQIKDTSLHTFDDMEEDMDESDYPDRDDFIGSNSDGKDSPITIKTGAILLDAPQFPVFKNKKWDSNKSMRCNQDSQRQEDLRRMRQIVQYLAALRVETDKTPKQKLKKYSGGIYCKLEQHWRNEINEKITSNNAAQRAISSMKFKQKPILGVQPFK